MPLMGAEIRVVTVDDAGPITELRRVNEEFLAPWEPWREKAFLTEDHQRQVIDQALARHGAGTELAYVILDDGQIVGRITVSNIVRGPFHSGNLGYWVGREHNGRGVGTAAVAAMLGVAFEEVGLHRLEAGTLLHNLGSQRVLRRNGFLEIGMAPAYLRIAGKWQDHLLFQRLNESFS
jgi:ribosomal-protein-alanine N-acetyltransferase